MPKEGDAVQGAVRRGELMDESRCCTNHGAPVQKSGVREREREREGEGETKTRTDIHGGCKTC